VLLSRPRWKKEWSKEEGWVHELPDYVEEFVEWFTTPRQSRVPPTFQEWADEHGFSRKTLWDWRHDPRVRERIQRRLAEINVDHMRVQEVVNALWQSATGGDVQAAKMYLEYTRQFMPQQRLVVEDKRLESLSDEEFEAELARIVAPEGLA